MDLWNVYRLRTEDTWALFLALSLTCWVSLSNSLHHSVTQYPHLYSRDNDTSFVKCQFYYVLHKI